MVIELILGLVDILAGIFLMTSWLPYLEGNGFLLGLAIFLLLKGVWYLIQGYSGKHKRKVIIDSLIDLASFALLMGIYYGYDHWSYSLVGIIILFKGVWNMASGLLD